MQKGNGLCGSMVCTEKSRNITLQGIAEFNNLRSKIKFLALRFKEMLETRQCLSKLSNE